ncbi:MAG: hydrogenase formation protein HypD [Desulfobacteraceae bacterium 4572_123]|nr:MAG: hydrogenase formation protein HypD [Desulfobacteraceae bacterium 4572_123]
MAIKHLEEYRDSEISRQLADRIRKISKKDIRLMEVCGTHTVSIFRSGIRSILPDTISLISGPGCPVCVTAQREIDAFIELSKLDDVIITTFGDLMRVPGTVSTLQKERADGRDIRIVYSTFDALEIARKNPEKKVVFLGVGFETTAPTIAASICSAQQMNINNFFVYSAHKLVPPALDALMSMDDTRIDGFILPGHVSIVIGTNAYRPFFNKYRIPCVVAGFEPVDLLRTISMLVEQVESNAPELENGYPRAVVPDGNPKAQKIMNEVFETVDAPWRGIGSILRSGLNIRDEFASYDAREMFEFEVPDSKDPKGCACGEILTGVKTPPQCSLYKSICTPINPVGPCMVSSEGTCAAYYRYHKDVNY